MTQSTTPPARSIATLEINDGRLPARMVAGRLRADLPRPAALPRHRSRLAMLLMLLAVPLVGATRRSRSA